MIYIIIICINNNIIKFCTVKILLHIFFIFIRIYKRIASIYI